MGACKSRLRIAATSSDTPFLRVILDARLYREIQIGYLIKHALVANDVLDGWDKLAVSEGLKNKIEDIQSTIGINFEVQRSTPTTNT
jgi:hypothetical protein